MTSERARAFVQVSPPGQADMVRAQWAHIRGAVAGQLLAHGCLERQVLAVPAAMPGAAFFGS